MISHSRLKVIRNTSFVGAACGMLYIVFRIPTPSTGSILSITFMLISIALFTLSIGFFTQKLQQVSEYLPLLCVISLFGTLLMFGQSLSAIGTAVIAGLIIGALLGLVQPSERLSLAMPVSIVLTLFAFPPILWPKIIPLDQLAAAMFLVSILMGIFSLFSPDPYHAASHRLSIYMTWSLFCGYAALSLAPSGSNLIIWGIVIGGLVGITMLATYLENTAPSWLWLMPHIILWQCRWSAHALFRQGRREKETFSRDLPQLIGFDVDRQVFDVILCLVGQSLVFHEEIDRFIDRLDTSYLRQNPAASYMAQQSFLDLPTTLNEALKFYLEMCIWRDKIPFPFPFPSTSEKSRFDHAFISQTWNAYVTRRHTTLDDMFRSGDMNRRLKLSPNQKIRSPYSAEGVFLDHVDWTDVKSSVSWQTEFHNDLSPATLLKGKSQDVEEVEAFLVWLDEIKSLRNAFLQIVQDRNDSTGWNERLSRLKHYGECGAAEYLAFVRSLRTAGLYFEAIDLSQAFITQFPISQICEDLEQEIARSEFQQIIERHWSKPIQIQIDKEPRSDLDTNHLRIVNRTRSIACLGGVPLHVLIHGPAITHRFALSPDQGKTISVEFGKYQVIVCAKDAMMPPIQIDWSKDNDTACQSSAQLIAPIPQIQVIKS